MTVVVDPDYNNPRTNCYVTLAEAELILGSRPYTDAWNSLSTVPSAVNWVVDGALSAGATAVTIKDGTGSFTTGNVVSFGADPTMYSISNVTANSFDVTPPLKNNVGDLWTVERFTYNEKEKFLLWSSQSLDAQVDWNGHKVHSDQPMRWPRNNAYDCDGVVYDNDIFPQDLKVLTAEYALYMAQRDLSSTPAVLGQGIKKAKVDVLAAEFDNSFVSEMAPAYIKDLIGCMGTWKANRNGTSKTMRLNRA